jgi:Calcineurin-like phosphoesterase
MILRQEDTDIDSLITLLGQALPSNAPRLVQLPPDRPIIYIGDIHGDLDAVEAVFSQFPCTEYDLVFMGDVVDRGPDSRSVLTQIAQEKLKAPSSIHLLMGNHEARSVSSFRPAEFWDSLRKDESERLAHHLEKLPWAAWHPTGILATHGGIPDLPSREAIDRIELGDDSWRAITWGDWVDRDSEQTGVGKRPSFGPTAFNERTAQLGVALHIRSHQPTCPLYSFADRCLTLFTSSAYGDGRRRVALWVPGKPVNSARDLELIEI